MAERDRNGLRVFKEELLKRNILEENGLALAQTYDKSMKRHNSVVRRSVVRGTYTDSCGLFRVNSVRAENTPVTYRAANSRVWNIYVNPSFLELDAGQQKLSLAYAASRAYLEAELVYLRIQLPVELKIEAEKFLRAIRDMKGVAVDYFNSLRGS